MPTSKDVRGCTPKHRKEGVPDNPQARPQETVEALQGEDPLAQAVEGDAVPGEDVTENPDTDELEQLPGPSQDEPNEPAG